MSILTSVLTQKQVAVQFLAGLCFTPFLHDAFSEDFKISIAEE
jgi:hypothetical protein